MENPSLEISTLFEKFGHQLTGLLPNQHKVAQSITNCRTSVLGGHQLTCNHCEFQKNAYNSCRNRHCPKCQFLTQVKWVEKRKEDLLPCQYFHIVFTIPSELRALFLRNKEICYNILFKTSSETLKEVARNKQNLGAEIGMIGVLHTWAQNLIDHPHIHFVVPGGGLTKDKNKWIKCKPDYFLSVKILSKVFKAKMLEALREAYDKGEFKFIGKIENLSSYAIFNELLVTIGSKSWVVYSKKPFAGPEQVLNYLGKYTHRIAISNYRLIKLEGEKVYFKVRDNANKGESKILCLNVKEFLRRFLMHVLPKVFVRLRHFGLLGNRYRREKKALIKFLEKIKESLPFQSEMSWQEVLKDITGLGINDCPKCRSGELVPSIYLDDIFSSS
jgi:hypothetical protein